MPQSYSTIIQTGTSEVIDRKSRFLGLAFHAESEESAMACLEKIRKQYYDARHNCWAYILGEDGKNERASDDGEPSGTAGRPILEVIRHAGLTYTLVIVTRYFGGTLLGTGGLVRAYTQAAEEALIAADTAEYTLCDRVDVETEYSDSGKLQYLYSQKGIRVLNTGYGEKVTAVLLSSSDRTSQLIKEITELTSGRAKIRTEEAGFERI